MRLAAGRPAHRYQQPIIVGKIGQFGAARDAARCPRIADCRREDHALRSAYVFGVFAGAGTGAAAANVWTIGTFAVLL